MTEYKKKIISSILASASVVVLASCLPENDDNVSDRDLKQIESQVQLYSNAFQQFTNRSLNAVVSSAAWRAQDLVEGEIDLSDSDFGALNMGAADEYVSSAYCVVDGQPYHMSWFDQAGSNGKVKLKGLGGGHIGQVNMQIRDRMSGGGLGTYDGSDINMIDDGGVLTLSGTCADIELPLGTVVSAISMVVPDNIAMPIETRTILRSRACGEGEVGGITQSVSADFYAEGSVFGNVRVGSNGYASESAVIEGHPDSGWTEVSNNCVAGVDANVLTAQIGSANIMDASLLNEFSGALSDALRDNLTDIACNNVGEVDVDDIDGDGDTEELIEGFDTCAESDDELSLLERTNVGERTLLETVEESIFNQCPLSPTSATFNSSDEYTFSGIHSSLDGAKASIVGSMDGEVEIQKTTKTWQILTDLGNGTAGAIDSAGNCLPNKDECSEVETIDFNGLDISCNGSQTIEFSCADAYPDLTVDSTPPTTPVTYTETYMDTERYVISRELRSELGLMRRTICGAISVAVDDADHCFVYTYGTREVEKTRTVTTQVTNVVGPKYSRPVAVNGWDDAEKLKPNDFEFSSSSWSRVSSPAMSCHYINTRTVTASCGSGYSGTAYQSQEQSWNATNVGQTPSWGAWSDVGTVDKSSCRKDQSSKSSASNNYRSTGGEVRDGGNPRATGNATSASPTCGGTTCFLGDTNILMVDGSHKKIEDIKVGDITATGTVWQVKANPRVYRSTFGNHNDFDATEIHMYDGIKVTGNHVVLDPEQQWLPIHESELSDPDFTAGQFVVYNLKVSNAIIPVVGSGDTVHYFADNRNNSFGESENGYEDLMNDSQMKIQQA